MELKTRRIVHTGVTKYPTDKWTAQQLREATPWGKGPKYLIRDRDKKYATHFSAVAGNIKEVKTPYRTPEERNSFEAPNMVMLWSLGPNGRADRSQKANVGVNNYHILFGN